MNKVWWQRLNDGGDGGWKFLKLFRITSPSQTRMGKVIIYIFITGIFSADLLVTAMYNEKGLLVAAVEWGRVICHIKKRPFCFIMTSRV
ncbi:hypothetical protein HanRHA438_Chr16g0778711 [Helianthus annuus]|nr:hypothetical protein HanRHA438_Chr16g0778711 [Helianthus annuus]